MIKDVFVGRKVLCRDFEESLAAMVSEPKDEKGFGPKKQKKARSIYPQLFLFYGEPGQGKSSMVRKCEGIARGLEAETKKTIKVVTVDFEDLRFTRNILQFTPIMFVRHLHAACTDPRLGMENRFSEFSNIEQQLDQVVEKVNALHRDEWLRVMEDTQTFDLFEGSSPKTLLQTSVSVNGASLRTGKGRQEAEAAFLSWLKNEKKLPDADRDLFENTDFRFTKALVHGIVKLSAEQPMVILLDNVDRVNNPMIEHWLRDVFLGRLFERKNRVVVVVSGREKMLRQYRNGFPEELLYTVSFDDLPFSWYDINECGKALHLNLTDPAVGQIEEATAGVPVVVRDVLTYSIGDSVPTDVLDAVAEARSVPDKTATIVTRFLSTCRDERTLFRILHLAMLPQCDVKELSILWNTPAGDIPGELVKISGRYSFITGAKIHDGVREQFRRYLIGESTNAMAPHAGIIKEIGAASFALYNEQLCRLQTAVPTIDKRFIDDRFEAALLGCISSLLWYDRDEVMRIVPGRFCECLLCNQELAGKMLAVLDEFAQALPSDLASSLTALSSGLCAVEGRTLWGDKKPTADEAGMLTAIASAGGALSTFQQAILHLRLGSSAYRSGDLMAAMAELEKCEPHVDESELLCDAVLEGLCGAGNAFLDAQQFETAVNAFGQAAEIRPDSYEAWYRLGCAFAALKRHVQAEDAFFKASSCKPESFECRHALAFEQYMLKKFEDAATSFTKAAGIKADSADVWHMLGLSRAAINQHAEAVESFKKAIAVSSQDAVYWYDMAVSQAIAGLSTDAIGSCGKALEFRPSHQKAAELLGRLLYARGSFVEAAQAYEAAVRINPQDERLWYGLGCAQLEGGEAEKAIRSLTKATDIKKDFADAFNKTGLALVQTSDLDAAMAAFKMAIVASPEHFEAFNNLGNVYFGRRNYEEALKAYTKSAEAKPDFDIAWYNRGRCCHALGRYEESLEFFSRALELSPGKQEMWYNKGQALNALAKFSEAAACFAKASELSPQSYDSWFKLGRALADQAKHSEAVPAYAKAAALAPDKEEAWSSLGVSYAACDAHDDAVAAFKKAAAINPASADTWHRMGVSDQAIHRFAEAVDSYRVSIEVSPQRQESWHNAGLCSYYQNKFDDAIELLSKAMELSPDAKDTVYALALSHHARGNYAEASRLYRLTLELAPDMTNARTNLALSLQASGEYGEAVKVYQKTVSDQPHNSEAWYNMGLACEAQGNRDEAIAAYARAAQIAPEKIAAWADMGRIQFALERYADAIESLSKVVEAVPDDADTWATLALAHYYIGRFEDAVVTYQEVIALRPHDVTAWGSLGLTYYTMGNFEKAVDVSEKALLLKPDELWIQVNLALAEVMALYLDKAKTSFENIIGLARSPSDLLHALSSLKELVARNPNLSPVREIVVMLENAWRKMKQEESGAV
jgi:tetratricopeptide (TPR) repeat protein